MHFPRMIIKRERPHCTFKVKVFCDGWLPDDGQECMALLPQMQVVVPQDLQKYSKLRVC